MQRRKRTGDKRRDTLRARFHGKRRYKRTGYGQARRRPMEKGETRVSAVHETKRLGTIGEVPTVEELTIVQKENVFGRQSTKTVWMSGSEYPVDHIGISIRAPKMDGYNQKVVRILDVRHYKSIIGNLEESRLYDTIRKKLCWIHMGNEFIRL